MGRNVRSCGNSVESLDKVSGSRVRHLFCTEYSSPEIISLVRRRLLDYITNEELDDADQLNKAMKADDLNGKTFTFSSTTENLPTSETYTITETKTSSDEKTGDFYVENSSNEKVFECVDGKMRGSPDDPLAREMIQLIVDKAPFLHIDSFGNIEAALIVGARVKSDPNFKLTLGDDAGEWIKDELKKSYHSPDIKEMLITLQNAAGVAPEQSNRSKKARM